MELHDKGIRKGLQMHEAQELALAEWILLPTEKRPGVKGEDFMAPGGL